MALMLDTCGLLSLAGLVEKRLSEDTLSRIAVADTVYISACSLFEIAIKHKKKGLDLGIFSDARQLWDKIIAARLHTVRVQARVGNMSDASDRSDKSDHPAPGASR